MWLASGLQIQRALHKIERQPWRFSDHRLWFHRQGHHNQIHLGSTAVPNNLLVSCPERMNGRNWRENGAVITSSEDVIQIANKIVVIGKTSGRTTKNSGVVPLKTLGAPLIVLPDQKMAGPLFSKLGVAFITKSFVQEALKGIVGKRGNTRNSRDSAAQRNIRFARLRFQAVLHMVVAAKALRIVAIATWVVTGEALAASTSMILAAMRVKMDWPVMRPS